MQKGTRLYRRTAATAFACAFAALCLARLAFGQSPVSLASGGTTVSFPSTNVGLSASSDITLNVNTSLTLTAISTSGEFAISNTSCSVPVMLTPGASCAVALSFSPATAGLRSSPLVLTDDKGTKYSFGLMGVGVGPTLTFIPGIAGTLAGTGVSGYGGDGGDGRSAQLNMPYGIAGGSQGSVYIADTMNSVVRKLDPNGIITTVAGNGTQGYSGDGGPATGAQLAFPMAVAVDTSGNLYIADFFNYCVRKVNINGTISTLAQGNLVRGIAVDGDGNVYFSTWPEGVWKIDSQGVTTKIAGNGEPGFSGDGGPATEAQVNGVVGLTVDGEGNVYAAEWLNSDVRKIDSSGIITTVAGNQQPGYSGDGGPALNAQLNGPIDVKLDAAGNLYITDSGNNRIRKVNINGTISSIAGDGNFAYAGDGGSAGSAQFASPAGIALDGSGNLLIADSGNNVIRHVRVDSSIIDFGKVTVGQTGGPIPITVANAGNADLDVSDISEPSSFAAQTTCLSNTGVKAGAECLVEVSFTPSANGNVAEAIAVSDNAEGNPHLINVKGIGYVPPIATNLVIIGQYGILPLNANLGVLAIDAMDANGQLVTDFTGVVTLQVQGPVGFTPYSGQVNAVGGIASFDLTTLILNVTGSYSIAVTSPGLSSMQVTFVVGGNPDFGIATSQQSLTVSGAGAASLNVTVTPTNGFSGKITLSCSGLPAHATCSFSPLTLTANGSDTALISVLTVHTGVSVQSTATSQIRPFSFAAIGTTGIGLAGLMLMPALGANRRTRTRFVRANQAVGLLIILLVALVGCGGRLAEGGSSHTNPGAYNVSVTAASGELSHSRSFTLVVQ